MSSSQPNSPSAPSDQSPANSQPSQDLTAKLDPADFYFDGPYLVFTAAYHLKRGACCHSGCRHCPYGESSSLEP